MGKIGLRIPRVKLFCGLIFKDRALADRAVLLLSRKYGRVDSVSDVLPFDKTTYYEEEMGLDLKRMFLSFERLIDREKISLVKHDSNRMELSISGGEERRKINIDPGYLTAANVSLATTKDFQHRVYVGRGIYLENTLRFRRGGWEDWEWTYPDYRSAEYKAWFDRIRALYMTQLKG